MKQKENRRKKKGSSFLPFSCEMSLGLLPCYSLTIVIFSCAVTSRCNFTGT